MFVEKLLGVEMTLTFCIFAVHGPQQFMVPELPFVFEAVCLQYNREEDAGFSVSRRR